MCKKTVSVTNILIPAIAMAFLAGASNANDVSHHSHGHDDTDFGVKVEELLKEKSQQLFGIKKPLKESAQATIGAYRNESQSASDQVLLAAGKISGWANSILLCSVSICKQGQLKPFYVA